VIDTIYPLNFEKIVIVVGYQREKVMEHIRANRDMSKIEFAMQEELLGTADATEKALQILPDIGNVVVLCGDVPLIQTATIRKLFNMHNSRGASATILTAYTPEPSGYGRIIRNSQGEVEAIVEHRDATEEQLQIKEINSGTYIFDIQELLKYLRGINDENVQREFYLTDIIHLLVKDGKKVCAMSIDNFWEVEGVNSKKQLERLEKYIQEEAM
ncbi:bifunctional UDP-N-acetylglucosamine diphosphorylase/glucosamine-1-phosphate N-acetyltransferase GlmU, partial [bacterium]